MNRIWLVSLLFVPFMAWAQTPGAPYFEQMDDVLPTPTETRLASGAPGPDYWQQQVDYEIKVTVDDEKQRLLGWEEITYYNRSPHTLDYLWVQLDQNSFRKDSDRNRVASAPDFDKFSFKYFRSMLERENFEGGVNIEKVTDGSGRAIAHTIVDTMMRLDLKRPLESGDSMEIQIQWNHNINNAREIWGRGGYEYFEEDGNYLYTIAQWFPRMAVYNDVRGWQNKPFLGRGEFALELGDYEVSITVPADHIVGATGVLQNASQVLSSTQRKRLKTAEKAKTPIRIVNLEEADENIKEGTKKTKTWRFKAENVRDFAFATSRRFLWDAMGVDNGAKSRVLCMSYYPREADALWFRFSTHAVAHTLDVYGRMTFPYPYPVAISVNGPVGGMEYPMISFNGPRAEEDGTYTDKWAEDQRWDRSKYGLISVVIHEVGHNWFPMIINSDERQWTWMDEGLNTFVQRVAELEWEEEYPSWRGSPQSIVGYMTSDNQVPIMTNSESILQFGNNAYAKPAAALTILRETILGRELFDHAFQLYSRRWKFKQPQPADFFRTLEDASGMDLDWFWRGWFYSTDSVDIGIAKVREFQLDARDPDVEKPAAKALREEQAGPRLSENRNRAEGKLYRDNRFPEMKDFYSSYDVDEVTDEDRESFQEYLESLEDWEKEILATKRFFYVVDLENNGLVMPVPLGVTYEDGSTERMDFPAEIWVKEAKRVSKLLMTKKPVTRLEIDPDFEVADSDRSNNSWPAEPVKSRFKLFKKKYGKNPMQKKKAWEEKKAKEAEEKAKEEEEKAKEEEEKVKEAEEKGKAGKSGSSEEDASALPADGAPK